MTIQEYLGWANSLLASYGLLDLIRATFVIVLGALVIKVFSGRKE